MIQLPTRAHQYEIFTPNVFDLFTFFVEFTMRATARVKVSNPKREESNHFNGCDPSLPRQARKQRKREKRKKTIEHFMKNRNCALSEEKSFDVSTLL